MNQVNLVGRFTKDPEVRYSSGSNQMAIARFTLAVDRPMKQNETDFIGCVAFGRTAELIERYMHKGSLMGLCGRIQTGSYEKDGKRVYTTDIVADRIEFLDKKDNKEPKSKYDTPLNEFHGHEDGFVYEGFTLDEDIPF